MAGRTVEVIKNRVQLPLPKLPGNLSKNIALTQRLNKKLSLTHKNQCFQSEVTPMKFD